MSAQQSGIDELFEEEEKISVRDEKILEGVRLFKENEFEQALKEFLSKDTAEFSFDEKIEYAYYLGLCYTKLKNYEEALNFLEQVVTSEHDILRVFQCRMTLAYIYLITKRVKMAEYELEKLQSSGMESPLLYNTLAYVAWLQKRHTAAIELYEKTLEIDSDNATALNCMGYILADTGLDVMRALRLCRKAVDFKPQNAAYLDSLGWAYYKSGEPVEARTWLRRALDIAPEEEEIKKHFKTVTGEKP